MIKDAGNCLLCGGHELRTLQVLAATAVARAYQAELDVSCRFSASELRFLECHNCGLRFFSPPITGAEQFYAELQRISWYYSAAKQEFQMAVPFIDPSKHVLEIGAGSGLFAQLIKPASYTGLEFSSRAVELAAAKGVLLLPQTVEAHAREHPGQYDVVCAFQVLEHVANPRAFLDAANDCLKPGGRMLMSVPSEDGFAGFAYWDVLNLPPHHVTRWTDRALRSIAKVCSLRPPELLPEPLGKNMRKLYSRAITDRWLARLRKIDPQLIDPRLRQPAFRATSAALASGLRRVLPASPDYSRRGQAILAVFEKPT